MVAADRSSGCVIEVENSWCEVKVEMKAAEDVLYGTNEVLWWVLFWQGKFGRIILGYYYPEVTQAE